MAIYGYTKNYKLIKPQYDSDTWHDYEYDNLDTIDAVLSAIYASGNWKGFWATNTAYVVGDVVIDQDTDTMYKVMVEHTTSAGSFAAEQTTHPDYYELWSPNNLAESWAIKTDGKVSNEDYSAKAYAISSGLISEGSAKEWATTASGHATAASTSAEQAATSANSAASSASSASTSMTNAATSAELSQSWAVSDTLVNDTDYSAKHYANQANTEANNAAQSATNAANSAIDSANSASASATSANNSHIWAEGTDAQVQALGGVHSSKVWAEQSTNANISLTNTPYTTNRILEIPQNIKLELNNGTLTLKAGSKVYVPNGPGVFNEKITSSDLTLTNGWGNQQFFVYIDINNIICIREVNFTESGSSSSLTSQYRCWYDTTNNLIKWTNDTGSTWREGFSFPIALITSNSSSIVSIDQVFNGFGYIGSHFFVLPGVKVQIPDERNEDSSYKTFSVKTNSVTTASFPNTAKGGMNWYIDNLGNAAYYGLKYIKFSENNLWESTDGNGCILKGVVVATSDVTSGVISNYKSCIVDSVANSNASNFSQAGRSYLSGLGMPSGRYIDLTLGASGQTYTAPANGWFCLLKIANDTQHITMLTKNGNFGFRNLCSTNSSTLIGFCPVTKGDIMTLTYTASGATTSFKFYYAEGEN